MTIQLRSMRPEDVEPCGRICYEAFKDIAEKHNFRPDFPSPEIATGLVGWLFSSPGAFNVVAESDGQVSWLESFVGVELDSRGWSNHDRSESTGERRG